MSYYTKQQSYNITKKIYRTLRAYSSVITWEKLRGKWGEYNKETQDMAIDYRGALVPTIIHECIHHWHPDWCETKVEEEERRIVSSITPQQAMNLINLFLNLFKSDQ